MPKYNKEDMAAFNKAVGDQLSFYDQATQNKLAPEVTPAIEGVTNDPARTQTTHQGVFDNWVNSLSNAIDGIQKGPAQHRLIDIQHELDLLDEDSSMSADEKNQRRQQLEYDKTVALQEIQSQQDEIDNNPVDMSYQIKQAFRMNEEHTSPIDYVKEELPQELGGSLSQIGLQLSSMIAPKALSALGAAAVEGAIEGAAGGAVGAAVGTGIGIATSMYLLHKARQQETDSEVFDAYSTKLNNLIDTFTLTNRRKPTDEEMRKMRLEGYKGLKELNDKNNLLMVGDIFETALMAIPAMGYIEKGLALSRAGRNAMRGAALMNTIYSEGTEEGRQWLWQQNYLNSVDLNDDRSASQVVGDYFSDNIKVGKAMFGTGDPSLYTNTDFRNAVRSGAILGGFMDGAAGTYGLLKDHMAYNKTLSALSSASNLAPEEDYIRYKAETLYSMFSGTGNSVFGTRYANGKHQFIYDALKALGNSNINGFDKDKAAQEAAKIADLYKEYENIQNPTKGPLKYLWNELDAKAKTKEEKGILNGLKREAFINTVLYKNGIEHANTLEQQLNNPEVTDSEGFITELHRSLEGQIDNTFSKLGIDKDLATRLGKDRIDGLLALQNKKNADFKEKVADVVSGKALIKERETRAEFRAALEEKEKGNTTPMDAYLYKTAEEPFIKNLKLKDGLKSVIAEADNARIRKQLDSDQPLEVSLDRIDAIGLPLSKETFDAISSKAEKELKDYDTIMEQANKPLEFDDELGFDALASSQEEQDKFVQEANRLTALKDRVESLKGKVVPNFDIPELTHEAYRRKYADLVHNESEAIKTEVAASEQNLPLERTKRQIEALEKQKKVYDSLKELHDLPEFKGYGASLDAAIEELKQILAQIETRMHDRNLKNEIISLEAITGHYNALGAVMVVNTATNEITLQRGSNAAVYDFITQKLGATLQNILNKATEEYQETGKLNGIYPQLIVEMARNNSSKDELKTVLADATNSLLSDIKALQAEDKLPLELEFVEEFIYSPEKAFNSFGRKGYRSGSPVSISIAFDNYIKTRSTALFRKELLANGGEEFIPILDVLEKALALDSFRTYVRSTYGLGGQLATEKEVAKKSTVGKSPSKQQLEAIREISKWLGMPTSQNIPYGGIGYLAGNAGTGKSFTIGLLRKTLGLGENEIFVAAHSKEAFENIAKTTGVNKEADKYTTATNTVDRITELLASNDPSLKGLKLIVLDEAGFINSDRFNALSNALVAFNKERKPEERVKLLATGDVYQLQEKSSKDIISTTLEGAGNMKVFKPLTIVYRTSISDITSVANAYFDNKETVASHRTRVNGDMSAGVIATKDVSQIFDILKSKLSTSATTSKLIIVNNETDKESIKKALAEINMPVSVLTVYEAQGSTYDEVYVALQKKDEFKETADYNKAMYTAASRASKFLVLADRQLTEAIKPTTKNDLDTSNTEKEEFEKNAKDYIEQLDRDLKTLNDLGVKLESKVVPDTKVPDPNVTSTDVDVASDDSVEATDEPLTPTSLTDNEIASQPIPGSKVIKVDVGSHELDLFYPQALGRDTDVKPGDEVMFVKALDKEGKPHIRVVRQNADPSTVTLLGIIGTENRDGGSEIEAITKHSPKVAKALLDALNDDNVIGISFSPVPGTKAGLYKSLGSKITAILTAKVKNFSPFKVNFNMQAPKDINEGLKEQIRKDVMSTMLAQGQRVKSIDVNTTVYTRLERKIAHSDDTTETIDSLPEHQKSWVQPGRPYLKVRVVLEKNNTEVIFNIPASPHLIDISDPHHAKFMSDLITFRDKVAELEKLYKKSMGDDAPLYGNQEGSVVTVGNTVLPKGELFAKSIEWYPGSNAMGRLAHSSRQHENILRERLNENLTVEEQARVIELRKDIHSLGGIRIEKSIVDEDNLTESQRTAETVSEDIFTKATNIELLGELPNGFKVYNGSKGLVGVRYEYYKGLYFKLKVDVKELDGKYVAGTKFTYNVQRSLSTSEENWKVVLNKKSPLPYTDSQLSEENVEDLLETIIEATNNINRNTGKFESGTGGAQNVLNALSKSNEGLAVGMDDDGKLIKYPIRKSIFKEVEGKKEKAGFTGVSLLARTRDAEDGQLPITTELLDHVISNTNGSFRMPIKIQAKDEHGDSINNNFVYTNYSGLSRTQIVLDTKTEEITNGTEAVVSSAPLAVKSEEELAEERKAKLAKLIKRNKTNLNKPKDDGKALSSSTQTDLGRDITLVEALKAVKKLIPTITEEEVQFVNQIEMLRITEGKEVWGYFKDGIIYVLKNNDGTVKSNIIRHEVFHRVFNMALKPYERLSYFNLARKLNKELENATPETIEEWMAEKFQEYVTTRKTVLYKFKALFDKILRFFGFVKTNQEILDSFFDDIDAGKYTSKQYTFNPSRAMTKVNERFGSVDNYFAAREILLTELNSYMNTFYNFKEDTLIQVEQDPETKELYNLPLTKEEAKVAFLERISGVMELYKEDPELVNGTEEGKNIPYYALLLEDTKVDGLSNVEAIITNFYEIYDEKDANLSQEIDEAEYTNLEGKTTARIKDFVANIWNTKGKLIPVRFVYSKLLDIFKDISPESGDAKEQLDYKFANDDMSNINVAAIHKVFFVLDSIRKLTFYTNRNGKQLPLPKDARFASDRVFEIDRNGSTIKVLRGNDMSTSDFFKRIATTYGDLDYNAINVLFRVHKASNTWNEMFAHFISQREKDPYGGVLDIKSEWNNTTQSFSNDVRYKVYYSNVAGVVSSLKSDVASGIRQLVSKFEISPKVIDSYGKAITNATTIERKQKILIRFFEDLGITSVANITSGATTLTNGLVAMHELLKDLSNPKNDVEDIIDNSTKRITDLSLILATNNTESAPTSYVDKKNRKRYKYIFHSGSSKIISQIIKNQSSKEAAKLFKMPSFVTGVEGVINRYKDNIFLNGLNKIYDIVDYDSMSEKNNPFGAPKEYTDEDPEAVFKRKFFLNFIGFISTRDEADKNMRYVQSSYSVSNKPLTYGFKVNALTKKEVYRAVEQGLRQDLERAPYIDDLKAKGISVANLEKSRNKFKFILDRDILKEDRKKDIDTLVLEALEVLENKATASFLENEKLMSNERVLDSRVAKAHSNLSKSNRLFDDLAFLPDPEEKLANKELRDLYATYYINNYINGHFAAQLYLGDQAFTKLDKWDDFIKRLQTSFGMGKSPYVGGGGMKKEFKLAVCDDIHPIIGKLTDYSGKLKKLWDERGYDSTDGQMYVLPSFKAELDKGYGVSEGLGNILKPVYFGIDKYGVPRMLKTSALVLDDEIVKSFPELKQLRDNMLAAEVDGMIYKSGFKVGYPTKLSDSRSTFDKESIVSFESQNFRMQLNPIADVDNKITNFSQLLYFLNANGLNTTEANAVYDANSAIIDRAFKKFLKKVSDSDGNINENKLRSEILRSLTDENGNVTLGSERIFDLINHTTDGKPTLDLSMPSIVKKAIVQIMSTISNKVTKIKFTGSKLILTSASPVKVYRLGTGIYTHDKLNKDDQTKANNFYTRWNNDVREYLIKAQEAISMTPKTAEALKEAKEKDSSFIPAVSRFTRDFENNTKLTAEDRKVITDYLENQSVYPDVHIPSRLRIVSDPLTGDNYAEAVMPRYEAINVANQLGKSLDELRVTSLGVRIPTSGIHSSIPIRVVGFIEAEKTNLLIVPDEIVPLHGSDFDVDSVFVIRRDTVHDGNSTEEGTIWFTARQERAYENMFNSNKVARKEKFGEAYDELKHRLEFANSVDIFADPETGKFLRYNKKGKISVLRGVPRPLTDAEQKEYVEKLAMFHKEGGKTVEKFAAINGLWYDKDSDSFISIRPLIAKKGDIVGYEGNVLNPNYISYLDSELALAREQAANEDSKVASFAKKTITALESLKDSFYRNRVVQGYLNIVTDEKNRADMLTPISQSVFEDDIWPKLRELLDTDDLLGKKDLNDHDDQTSIQMLNMAGSSQTGAIANTMKTLMYLRTSSRAQGKESEINYGERSPLKINGKLITKIENSEVTTDSGAAYNVWELMDSLLNSAIDNVKEQRLGIINLTDTTGNVFCMMVGTGVSMKDTVFFMKQPAVMEFSDIRNETKVSQKINELLQGIATELLDKRHLMTGNEVVNFTEEDWRSYLETGLLANSLGVKYDLAHMTTEQLKTQFAVLKMYKEFSNIGSDVFEVSRGLSLLKEAPVTYADVKTQIEQLERAGKESFSFLNSNLVANETNPEGITHIQKVYDSAKTTKNILSTIFKQHSKAIEDFVGEVIKRSGIKIERNDANKNVDTIKEALVQYLLSAMPEYTNSSNDVFTYTTERGEHRQLVGNEAWIQNFTREVLDAKAKHPKNKFLMFLNVDLLYEKSDLYNLNFRGGTSLTDDQKLMLTRDFELLPTELKVGLLKYSVLVQGLSFGVLSYSNYISPDLQAPISNFLVSTLDEITKDPKKLENIQDHFAIQLGIHNPLSVTRVNPKTDSGYSENPDRTEDSSWEFAMTGGKEAAQPLLLRKGQDKNASIYVQVSREENDKFSTSKYTKVSGKISGPYKLVHNIYYATKEVLEKGWNLADKFSINKIVRTADPSIGAKPVNGSNVLIDSIAGDIVVKARYKANDIIYLRDVKDVMRDNLYTYQIASIKNDGQTIRYNLREVKEQHYAGEATGNILSPDQIRDQFESIADVFRKRGFDVTLDANPDTKYTGAMVYQGGKSFVIKYNPNKRITTEIIAHEFSHLLLDTLGYNHPKVRELIEFGKKNNPEIWAFILRDKAYAKEDLITQENELAARLIGLAGAEHYDKVYNNKGVLAKVKAILKELLNKLFGNKASKERTIVNELFDTMLGKGIAFENKKGKNTQVKKEQHFKSEASTIEEKLKEASNNIVLSDDQESYVNRLTNKVFNRVNSFLKEKLSPYPKGEDIWVNIANKMFKDKDKTKDTIKVAMAKNKSESMTYDQYLEYLRTKAETDRVRGKIMHKLIQFKFEMRSEILKEVAEMAAEKPGQFAINVNKMADWLNEEQRWNKILRECGLNFSNKKGEKSGDTPISEQVLYSDALGVAGTADLLVKHADGTYTIADFKSGNSILKTSQYLKLMNYAKNHSELAWTNLNQAKLQLMMYAVIMKSMDPNVSFRDLKVLHISKNSITQLAYSVEIEDFLGVIGDYYKHQNPEFYAANKELFNPKAYGGSMLKVDRDLEETGNNPVTLQQKYINKARELANKATSARASGDNGKAFLLEEEAESLWKEALQLEAVDERLFDHKKDMGKLRRLFDNLLNVKDKTVQAFAQFLYKRKHLMHLELANLQLEHEKYLQPVIDEYMNRNPLKKGLSKATFRQLDGISYKEMYNFLYEYTSDGRAFKTTKGDMTDAQWAYSQWLRKTMRNQFYLTANPRELVGILEEEIKSASGDQLESIKNTLELAKSLPDTNKLEEFQQFKGRGFTYDLDFVPKVPSSKEEMLEHGLNKNFFKRVIDDEVNKYTSSTLEGSIVRYGLPFKFLNDSGQSDNNLTMNSSLIFNNFVASLVAKRYLDDAYSLGNGLIRYFEMRKDAHGNPKEENTVDFLKDQVMLHTLDEKQHLTWLTKNVYIGKHIVKIDAILTALRSYFGATIMTIAWKGAIVNTVMENLFNIKKATIGSIAGKLGIPQDDIDFTHADLAWATKEWANFQKDRIAGNERNNKVWNALKKLDYQTDNHLYPVDKDNLIGVKNKSMQFSTLFNLHSMGEQQTTGMVLLAQLKHNGMWNKYDDNFNWKGDVRGVDKSGNKIYGLTPLEITKLKKVSESIHGSYRKDERCAAEMYAIGGWLVQFKRFLPNAIHSAWASQYDTYALGKLVDTGKMTTLTEDGVEKEYKIFDWEGRFTEGATRTWLKWIGASIALGYQYFSHSPGGPILNHRWSELSNEQKQNVISVFVQAGLYGMLLVIAAAVFGDSGDDDELKRRFTRMTGDMIQGWNPMDLMRAGVNPTVVMPKLYQFTLGTQSYINSWVEDKTITRGPNKGKRPGETQMRKSLPIISTLDRVVPDGVRP